MSKSMFLAAALTEALATEMSIIECTHIVSDRKIIPRERNCVQKLIAYKMLWVLKYEIIK